MKNMYISLTGYISHMIGENKNDLVDSLFLKSIRS